MNHPPAPLKHEDFPKVRYWTRKSYTASEGEDVTDANTTAGQRGRGRAALGINVGELYIENADGSIIDGYVAAAIREKARSLWIQMVIDGTSPQSWTKVGEVAGTKFRTEMGQAFPQLRLCQNDWKVQRLAVQHYHTFDREGIASSYGVRLRENNAIDLTLSESDDSSKPSKRKRKGKKTSKSKKKVKIETEDNVDDTMDVDPLPAPTVAAGLSRSTGIAVAAKKSKVS